MKNKNTSPLNQNQAPALQIPDENPFARPELLRDIEIPQFSLLSGALNHVRGVLFLNDPLFSKQSRIMQALSRELSVGDPNAPVSARHFPAVKELEVIADIHEFQRLHSQGVLPQSDSDLVLNGYRDFMQNKPGMDGRREFENLTADALEKKVVPGGLISVPNKNWETIDPYLMVKKMRDCRVIGYQGTDMRTGKSRMLFPDKCGLGKLCPDAARVESQRIIENYTPAVNFFLRKHKRRTFQYAVFTVPNVAGKYLYREKRALCKRFASFSKRACMASVKGLVSIQEDPLGKDMQTFNVHLNVIMAVEGYFDWELVRKLWGFNIEFMSEDECAQATHNSLRKKGVDSTGLTRVELLGHAFRELCKYATQTVSAKSAKKLNLTDAPAFNDWPGEMMRYWIAANHRFRRTRSYGCLYDAPGYLWDGETEFSRARWLNAAGLDVSLLDRKWRTGDYKLDKGQRKALRDIILGVVRSDMRDMRWHAKLVHERGHGYRTNIDLIQGNKFGIEKPVKKDKFGHFATGKTLKTGPPRKSSGFSPDFDSGFDF